MPPFLLYFDVYNKRGLLLQNVSIVIFKRMVSPNLKKTKLIASTKEVSYSHLKKKNLTHDIVAEDSILRRRFCWFPINEIKMAAAAFPKDDRGLDNH